MIFFVIILPLISALFTGLCSRKITDYFAQFISTTLMVLSAFCAIYVANDVIINKHNEIVPLFEWISIGSFKANFDLKVDVLTAIMLIVVTSVSSLVHLYSVGYMHGDKSIPRFMSYLSLFTFFMLMLVTANDLIQLFLGWEGVGLCSYLLIGFWYKKQSANKAAMKAFVVNRVGDFAFAIGIFMIFANFNSVEFSQIFLQIQAKQHETIMILGHNFPLIDVICVLLFLGAMGKSAQIGLHTWLPDAMEGPTPVSALIHAATMVTAGVFLVARCSPLFEYAPFAKNMIIIVGSITCLFAASIALVQNDIKKIIAYSTCSQLGYMFFACGVSAYGASIFHLMTHAFFKALLFLGAGSVIHAVSGEQDIRKMGGIWKKIPFTYAMMVIGSIAIAGIYPFAGYFSKDVVLEAAYASGGIGRFAYYSGIVAAFFTAFYSWRLIICVFHNEPRFDTHHVHESPLSMKVPLIILSIGAICSGMLGQHLGIVDASGEFWNNSIETTDILSKLEELPILVKKAPTIVAFAGILLAILFYKIVPTIPQKLSSSMKYLYLMVYNKYYFDEMYECVFVKPLACISRFFMKQIDIKIIDRIVVKFANNSGKLGQIINKLQSGYIYDYLFFMLAGLIGFISWLILK